MRRHRREAELPRELRERRPGAVLLEALEHHAAVEGDVAAVEAAARALEERRPIVGKFARIRPKPFGALSRGPDGGARVVLRVKDQDPPLVATAAYAPEIYILPSMAAAWAHAWGATSSLISTRHVFVSASKHCTTGICTHLCSSSISSSWYKPPMT